jgi:signal peptidase
MAHIGHRHHRAAVIRFHAGLVALFVILVTTWLGLAATVPVLIGWRSVVITSNSMEPSIEPGDVVVARPYRGEQVGAGTVVVFNDTAGQGLVTHRVAGQNTDRTYATRGDNNRLSDSDPLARDRIVGVGRILVPLAGLPVVWTLESWWALAAFVAFLAAAGWLARFGLLARYNPWAEVTSGSTSPAEWLCAARPGVGSTSRIGRARWRTAVAFVVVIVSIIGALAVPRLARAAFADATQTSSTWSAGSWGFPARYLKTSGPGDRTSTPVLPLSTAAPTVSTLPNYDTNRDAFAGLLVTKGGSGAGETDATKHQTWSETLSSSLNLSGTARLTVWSAMKSFQTGKRGAVNAFLLDCPANGIGCTTFDSASLDLSNWSGGSTTWVSRTIDFGTVSRTIAAGRLLRVKVVVGSSSDDDMWFAYDTTTYPSALTVG